MTFAPETSSMSASSWCGYSARPRSLAHPAKASKTASGSGAEGSRSVSVIGQGRTNIGNERRGWHADADSRQYQQPPEPGYSAALPGPAPATRSCWARCHAHHSRPGTGPDLTTRCTRPAPSTQLLAWVCPYQMNKTDVTRLAAAVVTAFT